MKKIPNGFVILLLIALPILVGGGFYLYSKSNNKVQVYDNNTSQISTTSNNAAGVNREDSETKKFRIYRKYDKYVYLVGQEKELLYYKSSEVDEFKNYSELDYVQIVARSYTKLPSTEKEYVGVKYYSVDITEQINNILDIKLISETEFGPEDTSAYELSERFSNTPAIVKSIKSLGNNSWSLDLDILTDNPKWTPGGQEMLYINQNTNIRSLIVNNDTKNHVCVDGGMEEISMYESNTSLINWFKNLLEGYEEEYKKNGGNKGEVYYNFDISGNLITATYPRCSS